MSIDNEEPDQWVDQNYRDMVAANREETVRRFEVNADLDEDSQAWWDKAIPLGRVLLCYLLAWVLFLAGIAIWKGWVKL